MGSTVKQEGKYQYQSAPTPDSPSRMAGNVITMPAELGKEIDPRNRYRTMGEEVPEQKPLATEQPQQFTQTPQPQEGGGKETQTPRFSWQQYLRPKSDRAFAVTLIENAEADWRKHNMAKALLHGRLE